VARAALARAGKRAAETVRQAEPLRRERQQSGARARGQTDAVRLHVYRPDC